MDTTFTENDKTYKIEGGRVVEASVVPTPQEEEVQLKIDDRVVVGKKFGSIVGLIDTVYGKTAAIKFDDGSITEQLLEDLKRAPADKVAATSADTFEAEFDEYNAMEADTLEDIALKADKARELNLRAKAYQTNGQNSLADQILFDHVVTATYVDSKDLTDAAQHAAAAADNYLERLPKFELSETVHRGGQYGGDASWLDSVAAEIEPEVVDDGVLVDRATKVVASYSREQLENDTFMKDALAYAFDTVPAEQKTKFAGFINEAKSQRLAEPEDNTRTASVQIVRDLDGNEINLDDVPMEAIFG